MPYSTNTTPKLAKQVPAGQLLSGFDICDEETRNFLSSLIDSRQAPQAEVDDLLKLSLMRGVEEWDMLFERARSLQNKHRASIQDDSGSYGSRRGGKSGLSLKRRRGTGKQVSHFWGEPGETSEKTRSRKQAADAPFTTGTAHRRDLSQDAAPPGVAETFESKTEPSLDPYLDENRSYSPAARPALSNGTCCSNSPLLSRETTRPVKARGTSKSPFFNSSSALTPSREKLPQLPVPATTTPPPLLQPTKKKPRPQGCTVSRLPFPPLSAPNFGLIQEELWDKPFQLLIAVTLLIRTSGKAAIPVFRQLVERFPTPESLVDDDSNNNASEELVSLLRPLGLGVNRTAAIQRYARTWIARPPSRFVRYVVRNYPRQGDGRRFREEEEFGAEDLERQFDGSDAGDDDGMKKEEVLDAVADARARALGCAWEIGHLTRGPYALDSWRIFCRDVLLGRAEHWTGWDGKGNCRPGFQPEWMRVLPRDKELRALLRWMWMREGWEWDPRTGEREPLRDDMRMAVEMGRVGYDDLGNLVILDEETEGVE
ncbi:hypothetical protein N656DRAFT_757525 [Canariomyces notabilis]|uniref:HhH-GPD domain-containing protein n=1 Tax=Canariomyces notabilis TaxID=2074819 RepID=A0AAN6TAX8_9PEZI|nr:hypothetical protein N656DRAFT_757525 [Canariomyces arenarius]